MRPEPCCRSSDDVFLKEILLFPVARTGIRERIRVQVVEIISAVHANNDAVPRLQTVVSAERVKAGVSCDPPSRCDRHDRYQFPSSRIEGCFRDSEKRFWVSIVVRFFEKWFRFGDSGFVLSEIRSNSAEFGSSINGLTKAKIVDGLRISCSFSSKRAG